MMRTAGAYATRGLCTSNFLKTTAAARTRATRPRTVRCTLYSCTSTREGYTELRRYAPRLRHTHRSATNHSQCDDSIQSKFNVAALRLALYLDLGKAEHPIPQPADPRVGEGGVRPRRLCQERAVTRHVLPPAVRLPVATRLLYLLEEAPGAVPCGEIECFYENA